ncbi:MAG: rfbG [Caulobacteraceae bacterium]|nr:rfbG [Caulobacteraceae bacterium]
MPPDPAFWRGKRVLLTGHTGFKGAWASLWLARMGANVHGLALAPEAPSLYALAGVETGLTSHIVDLRDADGVAIAVEKAAPQLVLHMAAQPIVKRSIAEPVESIAINVLGTAHLLQALRGAPGLEAVLVVTSDKVYANSETGKAFTEDDRLGGKDPYSASKAACELVAYSFARTYFDASGVRLATARGGNVVGGGDFAADRLVPDIVRAARAGEKVVLRHPSATRPWQHALDCVSGYLLYLQGLAEGRDLPASLNFGPQGESVSVGSLANAVLEALSANQGYEHRPDPGSIEMKALAVDSSLARQTLGWRDRLTGPALVETTAAWYRAWLAGGDLRAFTLSQIADYEAQA